MSRAVRVLTVYAIGTKTGTVPKNDHNGPKKRGRVSAVKSGVTKWRPGPASWNQIARQLKQVDDVRHVA